MDILAHGLWSAALYKSASRKKKDLSLKWAAFFGVMPDLASFGVHTTAMLFGISSMPMQFGAEPEEYAHLIPQYVSTLYNISHSLIVFLAVFILLWVIRKRPVWELGAWALHILIDIPTHTARFFPTPFLWPLSDFSADGMSWGTPWFMVANYSLLVLTWTWLVRRDRKQKSGS